MTIDNELSVVIVRDFESIALDVESMHEEFGKLSQKNTDGPVNRFKLGLVNELIVRTNRFLNRSVISGFDAFDLEELPSNSDVLIVLAQHRSALEAFRCSHIHYDDPDWCWICDDYLRTSPPSKIKK